MSRVSLSNLSMSRLSMSKFSQSRLTAKPDGCKVTTPGLSVPIAFFDILCVHFLVGYRRFDKKKDFKVKNVISKNCFVKSV